MKKIIQMILLILEDLLITINTLRINQKLYDEIKVTESDGINRCINKKKLLSYYSSI